MNDAECYCQTGLDKLLTDRDLEPSFNQSTAALKKQTHSANMANVVKVPTPIRNLNYEVLEQLGMKLNYHMPLKDFRTLAGKMKYTYEGVKNLERQQNPTAALLIQWSQSRAKVGEEKTVTDLIEMLSQMGRDDAVDLMTQHEFTGLLIWGKNFVRELSTLVYIFLLFVVIGKTLH